MKRSSAKHFQYLFPVIFSLLSVSVVFAQIHASRAFKKISAQDSQYYLPPVSWLKVFSLGYNEAAADIIWSKFIIYFGSAPKQTVKLGMLAGESNLEDASVKPTEYHTINYVNAVTSLDSRFRAAYAHGARLTMYHKGVISRDTIESAIEILTNATRVFPDDGMMRFNLGFLYYYELVPFAKDSAEKQHFKETGAAILYKSALLRGAPPYAAELATSLLSRHGMNQLAIEHISAMILSESNPEIRAQLEQELKSLVGEELAFQQKQMREYGFIWDKYYSFIPFDLYTVLRDMKSEDDRAINAFESDNAGQLP